MPAPACREKGEQRKGFCVGKIDKTDECLARLTKKEKIRAFYYTDIRTGH